MNFKVDFFLIESSVGDGYFNYIMSNDQTTANLPSSTYFVYILFNGSVKSVMSNKII